MPSAAEPVPAVELSGVRLSYGRRRDRVDALGPLDARIAPGEFVTIVGPSGCGKSTLLRLVAGFAEPTGGALSSGGRPIRGPGPDRGMVFQQPRLFPWLTVRGNVEFGLRVAGTPKAERRARSAELLELVGLADSAGRRPYELSGGMQQRAAIARALAPDPSTLLMDEPFAALDALTRERLQEELRRIWQATGKTVLFVTHSVDEAVFLGTRILVLSKRPGQIVLDRVSRLPHAVDPHAQPSFLALRESVAAAVRDAAA